MAALICDLDGSAFKWGTNHFLPGAYEELKRFYDGNNELIFVTQRDESWGDAIMETESLLKGLFPKCVVFFGVTSPRILINDAGAIAINHKKNSSWRYDLLSMV